MSDDLGNWAENVKKAGDDAVHDVEAFEKKYPPEKIEEILYYAHEVVKSLYATVD